MIVMIGSHGDNFFNLKDTYVWSNKFSQIVEDTLLSSILLHLIFEHVHYDSLFVLKKNSVFSFPTVPKNLKQCEDWLTQ